MLYNKILRFYKMSSIEKKYNKLNEKSLKGYILINDRDTYIKSIVKTLLKPNYNIIPLEYIDEKIRIDCIRKNIECNINYDNRLEILTNIFLKECTKETSKIISEFLC